MSSTLTARRADLARAAIIALWMLPLAACASSSAMRLGQRAERLQDYDRAVVEYTKAAREHPDDANARAALDRARIRAAQDHFARGRRLAGLENYEEALVEFQLASELNPTDGEVASELKAARQKLRTRLAVSREGRTELQTLIERSRNLPAEGMELPSDVKLPQTMRFGSAATSRTVFSAMARFAGINIVFDPAFRDAPLAIDLRDAKLEDALTALTASTQTFYRVTAPRTITVIPDTLEKRREYEEAIVRVFHLSNADIKEVTDLLRIVIDIRQISPMTATNSIAIKDTPERIAAAGRLIAAIDKARPEVVIDVELLEVDRTRLREWGIQIASPDSPGISGVVDVNRAGFTLHNLLNLTTADVFMAGIPGVYYRLLKNDINTRALANPQLRTSDGLAAQARFGERVPVPVTTFAPIATGGINQQPITSFVYENIGVNIDITPRLHHDDEVSLALKISLSSISGEGFGGLPTFGNREINTTIRLKDGETNMLAGLIRDEERTVLSGVPGLSDLPLIGRLFANERRQTQETDILLTLTPHIVRVLELSESDLRPFKLGRDYGGNAADLPQQLPLPSRDEPILPGMGRAPQTPPQTPFPQPLVGTLPGTPVTLPKKPGGGGEL
jgi:general secretion pathway protein D